MINSQEYSILNKESQREILKRRVKDMVTTAKGKDTIIFMDKTARPLSTAFITEWKKQYTDEKPPEIKFLNIGTEKIPVIVRWAESNLPKPSTGKYIIEDVVNEKNLVDIFGKKNTDALNLSLSKTQDALIVDDVLHSGRSMRIAKAVISATKSTINAQEFFLLETDDDKKAFTDNELPFLPWREFTGVEDPIQVERDPYSQFGHENKRSFFAQPLAESKVFLRSRSRQLRNELKKLMTK